MKIKYLCVILQIAVVYHVLIPQAFAGKGFTISPSRVEGRMPAGKKYENVFTINNTESYPVTVTMEWIDRSINPLSKNWFTLDKQEITVPENDTATVKFTISPPENSQGELNARVLFTKEPPKGQQGIGISMRYNFPVYVIIAGTEQYDFSIKNIDVINKDETKFNIELYNSGNVHIRPIGNIRISSLSSSQKYNMAFDPDKWAIIPRESYVYSSNFKDKMVLPDGKYSALINIESGENENEGSNMKKLSKTVKFDVAGDKVNIHKETEKDNL